MERSVNFRKLVIWCLVLCASAGLLFGAMVFHFYVTFGETLSHLSWLSIASIIIMYFITCISLLVGIYYFVKWVLGPGKKEYVK